MSKHLKSGLIAGVAGTAAYLGTLIVVWPPIEAANDVISMSAVA